MKVSTRTRYGLRLLVYLASQQGDSLIQVKAIAKNEAISIKYLEQIIRSLKKAGMLIGERGAKGGYSLGQEPSEITIKDVFNALEDGTSLIDCLDKDKACERQEQCSTYEFWKDFNNHIDSYLENVTLADLVKMQREKSSAMMFYI